jgi:hypothetical protein
MLLSSKDNDASDDVMQNMINLPEKEYTNASEMAKEFKETNWSNGGISWKLGVKVEVF